VKNADLNKEIEAWIKLQRDLGKAPNTVTAYARGIMDFMQFCQSENIDLISVRKDSIAAYLNDLRARPPGAVRAGRSASHPLANSSLRHRLTVVRLFYDHLIEEGLRPSNPVARGRRGVFDGSPNVGARGLVPNGRPLPWIPTFEVWDNILSVAKTESIRNRLMLALSYDCALRREELCLLETSDIDPAHRLLTIRMETTKSKAGRVVPYSPITGDLFGAYLKERRKLTSARGPLFISMSPRNRGQPITKWTWSKVVRSLAVRSDATRLGTHTMRHLCLTDLARIGWDIHEIALFAGHRSIQTTLLYIHLSGRDLSKKFALAASELHDQRLRQIGWVS
jgi:integrase/recombinase XerD